MDYDRRSLLGCNCTHFSVSKVQLASTACSVWRYFAIFFFDIYLENDIHNKLFPCICFSSFLDLHFFAFPRMRGTFLSDHYFTLITPCPAIKKFFSMLCNLHLHKILLQYSPVIMIRRSALVAASGMITSFSTSKPFPFLPQLWRYR